MAGEDPPTGRALADLVLAARRTVEGVFDRDETAKAALSNSSRWARAPEGPGRRPWSRTTPPRSQVRSAYARRLRGFEQWLIKLDGVGGTAMDGHSDRLGESAPYGRIEYAYSAMAQVAGHGDDASAGSSPKVHGATS